MTANFTSLRSRFTEIQGVEKEQTATSICIRGTVSTPRGRLFGMESCGRRFPWFRAAQFPTCTCGRRQRQPEPAPGDTRIVADFTVPFGPTTASAFRSGQLNKLHCGPKIQLLVACPFHAPYGVQL